MTTTDQAWARGAAATVTTPQAPAPPSPPTHFPPTAEGGRPGRGPRRRFPRWIAATVVLIAVAAAGLGGGWALRGATTPAPKPTGTSPTTDGPPQLAITTAKKQTCEAYDAIGTQWTAAYKAWLVALPPSWTWDDPAVKTATATFDGAATQIATQMGSLVVPNTPADVSVAVQEVRAAIVSLAASHGKTVGGETNAKIDETMAKFDQANRVCGL